MVWQDYELIPTKRVNKDRIGTQSIYCNRLYLAYGGHTAAYFTVFGVYSANLYWKMHKVSPPVAKPLALAGVGAAALIASCTMVGDGREARHLMRNFLTYRREYAMIKDELYYQ